MGAFSRSPVALGGADTGAVAAAVAQAQAYAVSAGQNAQQVGSANVHTVLLQSEPGASPSGAADNTAVLATCRGKAAGKAFTNGEGATVLTAPFVTGVYDKLERMTLSPKLTDAQKAATFSTADALLPFVTIPDNPANAAFAGDAGGFQTGEMAVWNDIRLVYLGLADRDTKTFFCNVLGLLIRNHSSLDQLRLFVQGFHTGVRIRAGQFDVFRRWQLKYNWLGLHIITHPAEGGGNSLLFETPHLIGNMVGALVEYDQATQYPPLGDIVLVQPQIFENLCCGVAVRGFERDGVTHQARVKVLGGTSEHNDPGNAEKDGNGQPRVPTPGPETVSYNGRTIHKAAFDLERGHVSFDDFLFNDAELARPSVRGRTGSTVPMRNVTGPGRNYLSSVDATSAVEISGTFDCATTAHGVVRYDAINISQSAHIVAGPRPRFPTSVPNLIAAADVQKGSLHSAPGVTATEGTDARGGYRRFAFPANFSGGQESGARFNVPDIQKKIALYTVHALCSADVEVLIGLRGGGGTSWRHAELLAGEENRLDWFVPRGLFNMRTNPILFVSIDMPNSPACILDLWTHGLTAYDDDTARTRAAIDLVLSGGFNAAGS